MFYSNMANVQKNKVNQYLLKEILDATPEQIIIKIYDFAIVHCIKHDLHKTNKAIQELINALRFDDESAREIAVGLFRLYQFCQEQMRQENYEVVQKILTDLRDTWLEAFKNKKA